MRRRIEPISPPVERRRVALSTTAVAVMLAAVAAQTPPATPRDPSAAVQRPSFRTATDLVVVETTVVDRNGTPAPKLSAADFSVEIDGKAREIVSAEFVTPTERTASPTVDPEVSINTAQAQGRTILFVVDQASLTAQGRHVIESARRWLKTLSPGDRVGVVGLPAPGPRVELTTEHARVDEGLGQSAPSESALTFSSIRNVSIWEALQIADGDAATRQQVVARECSAGIDNACPDEIDVAAHDLTAMARARVQPVLSGLIQVLHSLASVPGPKHVVLVSAGWPILERGAPSEIEPVAAAAAAAHVMVHGFVAERFAIDLSLERPSPRPSADREMVIGSIEMLAGWTGGQTARIVGTGEGVFARLSAALTGYYRLAVRPESADLEGRPHKIAVKVKAPGVSIRQHRRFMMARPAAAAASTDPVQQLRQVVRSGSAQTAFELRATTYVLGDASNDTRVRVWVAGDVARAAPGVARVHVAFFDQSGNPEAAGDQQIRVDADGGGWLGADFPLPPGAFTMRVAVLDAQGGLATVERTVDARFRALGNRPTSSLALFRLGTGEDARAQPIVDRVSNADRLLMQVEIGAVGSVPPEARGTTFEILRPGQPEPLMRLAADVARSGSLAIAQHTMPVSMLPAGQYLVQVRLPDATAAALARRLRVETVALASPAAMTAAEAGTAASGTRAAGAAAPMASVPGARPPRFDPRRALDPSMVKSLFTRLAARPDSAPVRSALERAEAGDWNTDAVRGPLGAAPVAAHVVAGLGRMQASDFEAAANEFRAALRISPDFVPAMIYLGACYAAGGKDREAASAWQTVLLRERESPEVHRMAIEGWLRADRAPAALALVKQARALWPEDRSFVRLQALAALSGGKVRDGIDAVMQLGADADEPLILAALGSLYAAARIGSPDWDVGRDVPIMRQLREAYARVNGPSLALVDVWLEDVTNRK